MSKFENISQYSNLATFNYDYVRLMPQEQIGLHSQASWELDYIIKGSDIRVIGDTQESFSEGEVMLVPPQVTHCWYFDTGERPRPIENISVQISDEWLKNLAEICPELAPTIEQLRSTKSGVKYKEHTAKAITKILLAMRKEPAQLRVASLIRIFELLIIGDEKELIGRQTAINRDDERRKSIEIYVICNYARKISLDDAARHVGLSRSAFCRWMQQHMGTTFSAYLLSVRLQATCDLLKSSPATPISDICYQSGFSDISYFNRMFKRQFGVSPGEWRKNLPHNH